MAGRASEAVEHSPKALSISRRIQSQPGITFNAFVLILGLLELGQYDRALELAEGGWEEVRSSAGGSKGPWP
jgi:hypothetical protein